MIVRNLDELKQNADEAQGAMTSAIENIARGGTVDEACEAINAAASAKVDYQCALARAEGEQTAAQLCERLRKSVEGIPEKAAAIVARGRAANPNLN